MSKNRVPSKETQVCAAVAALLEREAGIDCRDVSYPEKDASGPPVDLRFRLGMQRFAVEHTLIEPFERALASGLDFLDLTEALRSKLNGSMPTPGTWYLLFPVDPAGGRPLKTHPRLRDQIEAWVHAAATELLAEYPERRGRDSDPQGYFGSRRTEIDGLALQLQRRVHWSEHGKHDGTLFLSRIVAPNLEVQRVARIRRAIESKLPKLTACKLEGDATVLALEYSDIALTSHISIAEALQSLWKERVDWPDHVIIVDTTLDKPWQAYRPVVDKQFSFEMEFIEIAPDEPADVQFEPTLPFDGTL